MYVFPTFFIGETLQLRDEWEDWVAYYFGFELEFGVIQGWGGILEGGSELGSNFGGDY